MVTVAPGTIPPCPSTTVPSMPLVNCARRGKASVQYHQQREDSRYNSTLYGSVIVVSESAADANRGLCVADISYMTTFIVNYHVSQTSPPVPTCRMTPAGIQSRTDRHRTKQEFAYQTLKRRDHCECDLRPNERLVIDDLARRLHVSAIPVREAIQMLQSEGLVVSVPHTGASVAPVSRCIDSGCVRAARRISKPSRPRLVAERGKPDELDALAEARRRDGPRRRAPAVTRNGRELNTQFHRMIGELPGLPMLPT